MAHQKDPIDTVQAAKDSCQGRLGARQAALRKKPGAQLLGRLRVFFIKENYCAFSLGFREILRNTEQVFLKKNKKKHDPLWSRFPGHEMNNRLLPH